MNPRAGRGIAALKTTLILCCMFCSVLTTASPRAIRAAESVPRITTPKEYFGFNLCDDYCLANYQQLAGYWSRLARESNRLKVVCIGATEEGRPQLMGIVTSPANHRELARYQEIARRLGFAEIG